MTSSKRGMVWNVNMVQEKYLRGRFEGCQSKGVWSQRGGILRRGGAVRGRAGPSRAVRGEYPLSHHPQSSPRPSPLQKSKKKIGKNWHSRQNLNFAPKFATSSSINEVTSPKEKLQNLSFHKLEYTCMNVFNYARFVG